MGEDIELPVNDVTREIGRIIRDLKNWKSPKCDETVKNRLISKLQNAQLWSLRLLKESGEKLDNI